MAKSCGIAGRVDFSLPLEWRLTEVNPTICLYRVAWSLSREIIFRLPRRAYALLAMTWQHAGHNYLHKIKYFGLPRRAYALLAMTCHYEDEHSEDEVIQKYKYLDCHVVLTHSSLSWNSFALMSAAHLGFAQAFALTFAYRTSLRSVRPEFRLLKNLSLGFGLACKPFGLVRLTILANQVSLSLTLRIRFGCRLTQNLKILVRFATRTVFRNCTCFIFMS